MRTKIIQISAGLVALFTVAIGLASMNADTSSASAHTSTLGSTNARLVAHAPDCAPNWDVVESPNVPTRAAHLTGVAAVSASEQ